MKYTIYYDETIKEYRITTAPRAGLPWIYTPIMSLDRYSEAQALVNMLKGTVKVLRKKGL